MTVLLGRGQQADPTTTIRESRQLCQDWFRLLREPSFTCKLPRRMEDKLHPEVDGVGFALAVSRGELAKKEGQLSGRCEP
jgi:hypothetical protein